MLLLIQIHIFYPVVDDNWFCVCGFMNAIPALSFLSEIISLFNERIPVA